MRSLVAAGIAFRRELVYGGDVPFRTGVASAAHFPALAPEPSHGERLRQRVGLLERGARIPGEISVVGFDDVGPGARVFPRCHGAGRRRRSLGVSPVATRPQP